MHVLLYSRVAVKAAMRGLGRVRSASEISRSFTSVLLSALALGACKASADSAKVESIVGLGAIHSMRVGQTRTFDIEMRDGDGNRVTGRNPSWSSLNPTVVAIDASGVATGLAVGSSLITARADGATAQTNMTVQPLATSLVLLPASATVPIGTTRTLTVALSDRDGQSIGGRLIAYSSSNPSIATVNASGTVVGVSQGRATITGEAVLDKVVGTSVIDVVQIPVNSVSISPAGGQTVFETLTLQLSATLRDQNGNIITGRPVSWTTSNPSIATVSPSGLVTGVTLGTVQITAECEGRTAGASVTVAPRPVATVGLTPNPLNLKVGTVQQMSLDLRDASGNQLTTTGRTVTWDSSNRPVANVQDGVVSGLSTGTANITVTVDGKPATAVVNVTP